MNKVFAIMLLLLPVACDNSLEVIDPADSFPVVYGVVCPKDSVHRIVVRKSFICCDSIEWHAQNPDSIQYDSLSVFLEVRNQEGIVIQRISMQKELGQIREAGFFAREPNWIYTCAANRLADPDSFGQSVKYNLTVFSPIGQQAAYAETVIPPTPKVREPADDRPYEINMMSENPIIFKWDRSTEYYVQFNTRVKYWEYTQGRETLKEFVHKQKWSPWSLPLDDKEEKVTITGDWFYSLIAARIRDDESVENRKFKQIDFELISGDEAFMEYFSSIHYSSDYESVPLTNIVNGKGLFVGYNVHYFRGYGLTQQSKDSLAEGERTRHLRFYWW
jgi:hypothetical protein